MIIVSFNEILYFIDNEIKSLSDIFINFSGLFLFKNINLAKLIFGQLNGIYLIFYFYEKKKRKKNIEDRCVDDLRRVDDFRQIYQIIFV